VDVRSFHPNLNWAVSLAVVAVLSVPAVAPALTPGTRIFSKAGATYRYEKPARASSKARLAPSAHAAASAASASAARAGAR
jgi:hypothetical protein